MVCLFRLIKQIEYIIDEAKPVKMTPKAVIEPTDEENPKFSEMMLIIDPKVKMDVLPIQYIISKIRKRG